MESPLVGAYNFKDWWVTVWTRTAAVRLPDACACCLEAAGTTADAGLDLGGVPGRVPYPICATCESHARVDDRIGMVAVAAGALVPPAGWYMFFGLAILRRIHLMLLGWLFSAIAVAGLVYVLLRALAISKKPSCADDGWPVEQETGPIDLDGVVGADTIRSDEKESRACNAKFTLEGGPGSFGLRFRNLEYARRVLAQNGGPADVPRIDAKM